MLAEDEEVFALSDNEELDNGRKVVGVRVIRGVLLLLTVLLALLMPIPLLKLNSEDDALALSKNSELLELVSADTGSVGDVLLLLKGLVPLLELVALDVVDAGDGKVVLLLLLTVTLSLLAFDGEDETLALEEGIEMEEGRVVEFSPGNNDEPDEDELLGIATFDDVAVGMARVVLLLLAVLLPLLDADGGNDVDALENALLGDGIEKDKVKDDEVEDGSDVDAAMDELMLPEEEPAASADGGAVPPTLLLLRVLLTKVESADWVNDDEVFVAGKDGDEELGDMNNVNDAGSKLLVPELEVKA